MIASSGAGSPQLASIKSDTVQRLWLFSLAMRIGIWIDKRAVNDVDHSLPATHITGEACMSRRIKIFGYDTVSYFETRLQSSFGCDYMALRR